LVARSLADSNEADSAQDDTYVAPQRCALPFRAFLERFILITENRYFYFRKAPLFRFRSLCISPRRQSMAKSPSPTLSTPPLSKKNGQNLSWIK